MCNPSGTALGSVRVQSCTQKKEIPCWGWGVTGGLNHRKLLLLVLRSSDLIQFFFPRLQGSHSVRENWGQLTLRGRSRPLASLNYAKCWPRILWLLAQLSPQRYQDFLIEAQQVPYSTSVGDDEKGDGVLHSLCMPTCQVINSSLAFQLPLLI